MIERAMFRPVTVETTRLLALGYPPHILAKLDGVTKRAIHLRRQRFEKATGGESTGRFGKRGRPVRVYANQLRLFDDYHPSQRKASEEKEEADG